MKVSLNWLKEYVNVDLDPLVIAEKLTMAGLEVEAVEERYNYLDNHIVTARVIEVNRHPNADKLSVCRVDAGRDEPIQIVCGAPNVHEGMFVSCALPGAVLPGDFKIKKGKLRGEVSAGMLCSPAELRLGKDAAGIMDLNGSFVPGTPIKEALKLSDTLFEVDLTPNRPDCLSYIGVAREIAAFKASKQKITLPDYSVPEERTGDISINDYARVEISDPDLCPRYAAGLLVDVKIEPSPFWLQDKLESIGLTPINNVVDITNFVMMETGQPLHAFDFDKVAEGRIIVRRAGNDVDFTTLDSKAHKLEPDMLMICDGDGPVALAGVMGGENSEISDATTRVLVESAYFDPVSIRKTVKKTKIATDASHRFERGIDPEGTLNALNRSLALIAQVCSSASIAKGIIDEYPLKKAQPEIDLNTGDLNIRLGTQLDISEIKHILESVDFEVEKTADTRLKVGIPSFRVDVTRPEDLSEEVARLWGYNNIEISYPKIAAKGKPLDQDVSLRQKIRLIMIGFSFFEVINYNFINENSCDGLNLAMEDKRRDVETILNPISDQMSVLRSSLIPGLLGTMKRTVSFQSDTLKLFETGKIFFATQKGDLPEEREVVAGLMTGNQSDHSWHSKKRKFDFFDLKGVVEGLLQGLLIGSLRFEKIEDGSSPYYKKGYAAFVKSGGTLIGTLGQISEKVLKNYGLKQDAFIFDLDFMTLKSLIHGDITAVLLPKFPSVSRDITIIVDRSVTHGEILNQFEEIAQKQSLVEKVSLFDVFEGEVLSENKKKSLSFRIVYRAANKTLKEENIKKLHTNISKTIIDQFNAEFPE